MEYVPPPLFVSCVYACSASIYVSISDNKVASYKVTLGAINETLPTDTTLKMRLSTCGHAIVRFIAEGDEPLVTFVFGEMGVYVLVQSDEDFMLIEIKYTCHTLHAYMCNQVLPNTHTHTNKPNTHFPGYLLS